MRLLNLALLALLRLYVGCQAWIKWQPDGPIFAAKSFATTPRNYQQQRKRRTC